MNDLERIPDELRLLSLSDREIVLPFDAILKVIECLRTNNVALGGWEGWILYSDGSMGHDLEFPVGVMDGMGPSKSWEAYVARSTLFCVETIKEDYVRWRKMEHSASWLDKLFKKPFKKDLYFCISCHSQATK